MLQHWDQRVVHNRKPIQNLQVQRCNIGNKKNYLLGIKIGMDNDNDNGQLLHTNRK